MVLERHHSRRICLMLLALDTPKLCERFSLGLESTGLGRLHVRQRETRAHRYGFVFGSNTYQPQTAAASLLIPVPSFRLQPFKDRPARLGADVARQRLRSHQLPSPLAHLPEGPFPAHVRVSVGQQAGG